MGTNGTTEHRRQHGLAETEGLNEGFGSLARSFFSMFMSVTGGKNWIFVITPLFQLSPPWLFTGLFLLYISITFFGVLNILTSVFVESAIQSTANQRELLVQERQNMKESYIQHIREIFSIIDTDGSGEISLPEIQELFADDTLHEFLEALEVNASDARALFTLIDTDCSGLISMDEFCNGCLKLKGEAKSFDVNCLIYENQRYIAKTIALMERLEEHVSNVSGFFQRASLDDAELRMGLQELTKSLSIGNAQSSKSSKKLSKTTV